MKKTRYAIVGLGARHEMYRKAITETHSDRSELAGLCDSNEGRLALALSKIEPVCKYHVPGYSDGDFDRMISETRPDTVIVTTRDSAHDKYICRAMELGCDVITEKPMTIDADRCQRIIDTRRKTGRKITVTFNYRYSPPRTKVKETLMSGAIGDILSVDFHWMLNTYHGADYFRRWHREKANSGGLMVHKATHHFDLINWWLSSLPERVYAKGHRRFYVPATADRMGLVRRSERCHDCPESKNCALFLDLAGNAAHREMYLDCERHDGYYRDRCVFSDEMDIEDTVCAVIDYASGAKASYSLNAFCGWEGYTVGFNGTLGRLDHKCEETVYVSGDGTVPGALKPEGTWIRVYPLRSAPYQVDIGKGSGGHGGADPVILGHLFDPESQPEDPTMRMADHRAGAYSILTGIAANMSMECGQPVEIDGLVSGLDLPDYPPMPDGTGRLDMNGRPGDAD